MKLIQAKSVPTLYPQTMRLCLLLALLPLAVTTTAWSQAPAAAAAPATSTQTTASPNTTTTTSGRGNQSNTDAQGRNRDANTDQADRRADVPAGSQDQRTEFQQMVEATTGRKLPIFGAGLFGGVPSTFAPVSDVPVSPTYVIGPGDELDIEVSGQVNQTLRLTVDRTGGISLPGVGTVHVAGLPYGNLTKFLTDEFGKIYRNFTLNANLGSLRTIQVFVTGQARRPGAFSISSLSTLLNAVFASGGPDPQGSLRDIQVRRGGSVVSHFDLYDLLLNGDKTRDISLVSGDVIFIPNVGPQIAVVGSVNNPAIYELKGATSVADGLKLSGGMTPVAAGATVRLERIDSHSDRSIEDLVLDKSSTQLLQSGDIISVTSVIDRFKNAVTLRGNVANPGRYVWHPGMRISDLIPTKEALITRNYWRKRNQLGQIAQDYVPDSVDTSTEHEGALQVHGNAIDQKSNDTSQKGTANGNAGGNSVGAALTANNGAFDAKNDIILSAADIYWGNAEIERQSATNLTTSLIPFNLGSIVLDGKSDQNYELLPGDVITIFSKSDLRVATSQQTRFVRLEGEFNAVGVYSVQPGETLRGLLRRVGGFTPDAYLFASEFTRESTRRVEQQRLNEYADQLEAQISSTTSASQARAVTQSDQLAASASAADARTAVQRLRSIQPIGRIVLDLKVSANTIDEIPDLALEDGDRFVVPRVPSNVSVEGQVYNANAFVYTPGEHVIDYLRRAGGPDRQADHKRMFILRADGSVVSRQYSQVDRATIFPGDTIVVPPIIDKRALLQRIATIAQAIGNFGIGAAAVYFIAR